VTPLDQRALDDVLDLLRFSAPGERRTRQLQTVHELLVDSDAGWMLQELRQTLRKVQWSGTTGPMVDRRKCCPTCGGTPELGHITGCALGRAVEWLG
jgi:hypothetical protein